MERPLVSIITPTYNHEKYLGECIESVLRQSYSNWEMIIVNDGSSDHTLSIASTYQDMDTRIKLINQENIGIFRLSETYNKIVAVSQGSYLAILEGDDCWEPQKLEKQVAALEADASSVLCWGMARCVSADRSEVYYTSPDPSGEDSTFFNNQPVGSILNVFLYRNCIPALTILVRKEAIVKLGGFVQPYDLPLVDLPTLYKLSALGHFTFLPEVVGEWRNYANQVTKTYPAEMMAGFYQLAKENFQTATHKELLKTNEAALDKYYAGRMVIAFARSGRYKLIRGFYAAARKDYVSAIFGYGYSEPIWKVRALVGWVFSLFHLNVEGLAKVLGKRSYKRS